MITLNRDQLKALAESGRTRETLEDLYSWKQDRGITYSESLQLLAHEEGHPLQQGLLKVPRGVAVDQTIWHLRRWADNYSYVESPVNSEDEFLEALLLRVCSRKAPDSWVCSNIPPLVYLRKYPKCVHARMRAQMPNLTPAMQQVLRSYNWATPDRLAELLEDSGREWTFIERNLLSCVLQDSNAIRAFTSDNPCTWEDSYESFMPALTKCIHFPQLAPKVVGVMSTRNLTDKEAEAVVATDMATELLQEFFEHIQKDLRYYSEKYADYRVYSEYAGVLAEDKDELLGRLTAWNHHITQGVGSTFLIISVWEPGKDPKSAYRYYLVKE